MEYRTADGFTIDDEMLSREAEAFEAGDRPDRWRVPASRPAGVALPAWEVAKADAGAQRLNIGKRAALGT